VKLSVWMFALVLAAVVPMLIEWLVRSLDARRKQHTELWLEEHTGSTRESSAASKGQSTPRADASEKVISR
jgi:hypothetical protein